MSAPINREKPVVGPELRARYKCAGKCGREFSGMPPAIARAFLGRSISCCGTPCRWIATGMKVHAPALGAAREWVLRGAQPWTDSRWICLETKWTIAPLANYDLDGHDAWELRHDDVFVGRYEFMTAAMAAIT